jgi:hypothetical protein
MYIWKFEPERQEFDLVKPIMMQQAPGACYIIRDELGDLFVRDRRGRECPAHFDFVEVLGMRFDREQFDPKKVDSLRTRAEPPIRSLFSLSQEDIESLREEMRRDGEWMRDQLRRKNGQL